MDESPREESGEISYVGEAPARRRRGSRFSIVRFAFGLLLLGCLAVGASWAWVFFFYPPDAPFEPETFPDDGGVVLQRAPLFQWASEDADGLFRVLDSEGRVVWEQATHTNEVTVPEGVLLPGRSYRWRVYPGGVFNELSPVPSIDRAFKMAPEIRLKSADGSLTVFPAVLTLAPRNLTDTVPLEVVCTAGSLEVDLPQELTREQGNRKYVSDPTGVQFYLKFDPTLAADSPEEWMPVLVTCGDLHAEVPIAVGALPGKFEASHSVGFRPYLDTPSFANFAESTLAILTDGTCVGIAFTVQLLFQKASFGPDARGKPVDALSPLAAVETLISEPSIAFKEASDLRDLTARRPSFVRDMMSTVHLENMNPANLTGTIRAALIRPGPGIGEEILDELDSGRVAVVAGFRLKTRVFKSGEGLSSYAVMDGGHAFVAYRAWCFQRLTVFAVYDPNFRYQSNAPLSTLLLVPKEGRPAYFIDGTPDRYMVRFMVMSSSDIAGIMGPLTQSVEHGLDGVFQSLGAVVEILGRGVGGFIPGH